MSQFLLHIFLGVDELYFSRSSLLKSIFLLLILPVFFLIRISIKYYQTSSVSLVSGLTAASVLPNRSTVARTPTSHSVSTVDHERERDHFLDTLSMISDMSASSLISLQTNTAMPQRPI